MKKIAMFTMGTRGDVQPYIFLSKGLMKEGFDVILGSHPCWRGLVEEAGIHFEPIGPDIDIEEETSVIRGRSSNQLFSMLKTMNFVLRIIQGATNEVYELCKGKDLIIVTHSMIGAVEAGVLEIPTVNVTLQTEMIGEKLKPQKFKDKLIGGLIARQVAKPYNKIRKVYGLKPVKTADEIMSDKLNLIPISQYVLERNKYWEDKNILTGYWYEEDRYFTPEDKLQQFLDSGDKPVILTLGAMSFETAANRTKLDMFVNAFEKTGERAIIQGFQKTLQDYELPDTMTVDEVDRLTREIQLHVFQNTGVILTGIGVYSYNTSNDEAAEIRNAIQKRVLSHDWTLQLHGFYADVAKKMIRFDVVVSFEMDHTEACRIMTEEVKEMYPEYELQIVPDVDISD